MANQWYNIFVYELYDGKIVKNCSVTLDVKTKEDGRSYEQRTNVKRMREYTEIVATIGNHAEKWPRS